jgi:hypothetical protein
MPFSHRALDLCVTGLQLAVHRLNISLYPFTFVICPNARKSRRKFRSELCCMVTACFPGTGETNPLTDIITRSLYIGSVHYYSHYQVLLKAICITCASRSKQNLRSTPHRFLQLRKPRCYRSSRTRVYRGQEGIGPKLNRIAFRSGRRDRPKISNGKGIGGITKQRCVYFAEQSCGAKERLGGHLMCRNEKTYRKMNLRCFATVSFGRSADR